VKTLNPSPRRTFSFAPERRSARIHFVGIGAAAHCHGSRRGVVAIRLRVSGRLKRLPGYGTGWSLVPVDWPPAGKLQPEFCVRAIHPERKGWAWKARSGLYAC